MNIDQDSKTGTPSNEKSEFRKDFEKFLGNASLAWGFALGFIVHKYLLGVGKIGLLWCIF